ncbi:hypothetical protein KPL78_29495 [Roseomonas sp. HJA6]|uniref:Peptidase S53 domain-containing protein n=1 Tax=Roseomonas alba TaxID=2846776 RepID=A0ABS7AJU9_9PROT|nr:hypothetical protein [Neoroseomonas alba]MBW6402017.1 hypothetical protein [Neoroseomonas alba]
MSGTLFANVDNSTFLDLTAYELTSDANVVTLASISGTSLSPDQLTEVAQVLKSAFYGTADAEVSVRAASGGDSITIALVLDRANDPDALLSGNWAARQAALADQPSVASLYGADPATYQAVVDAVTGAGALDGLTGTALLTDGVYVSSAESRTVWLTVTADEFAALFDTQLLTVSVDGEPSFLAWAGSLSLPTDIAGSVAGLWVDQAMAPEYTEVDIDDAVDPATLGSGALGVGNGATTDALYTPDAIARLYDFPLSEAYEAVAAGTATDWQRMVASLSSPTVGLVEGTTADALKGYLNDYRAMLNLPAYGAADTDGFAAVDLVNLAGSDTVPANATSGETTLDVSIIATAAPNSSQVLYGYSGQTTYTGYQSAIFDAENAPSILTSSYSDHIRPTPDSPFAWAYEQLFVDAQLRNITALMSSGDGGSSAQYATGNTLVHSSHAVGSAIIVGGSSLSTFGTALTDTTLEAVLSNAQANDLATLLQLVAGGLAIAPAHLDATDLALFVETVWYDYRLEQKTDGTYEMDPSYLKNAASGGGIDTGQPIPSYQAAFGLPLDGRGIPDVSAVAGGNTWYKILNPDYDGIGSEPLTAPESGTSAAAPLWAALTAQLDVIFQDQGLPELGYYNDLLYIAAAIAPGSFNDVTIGHNTASFFYYHEDSEGAPNGNPDYAFIAKSSGGEAYIFATGLGYPAIEGYDLTTGLGTPNGLLLARALTAIAHAQMGNQVQPDVVSGLNATTAASGADQALLVQVAGPLGRYQVTLGDQVVAGSTDGEGLVSGDAVVQKMLQSDFDATLVQLLDGASHVASSTVAVTEGDAIGASMGDTALGLYQAGLTAGFGFVSFGGDDAGVTVARPVAIAETPGDANGQDVVVRMRQSGAPDSTLMIYRVDDLSGTVDGQRPGDAGYAAAAEAAAYTLKGGGTVIAGPGFGNYAEAVLTEVDDGDILAMRFSATFEGVTATYWAFAEANETVPDGGHATHIWNYGLNTWGWEDTTAVNGSDFDYNDLIVQFDFTSLTGHDLIA